MARHSRAWHDMHDEALAEALALGEAAAMSRAINEAAADRAVACSAPAPAPLALDPAITDDKHSRRVERSAHILRTGNFDE